MPYMSQSISRLKGAIFFERRCAFLYHADRFRLLYSARIYGMDTQCESLVSASYYLFYTAKVTDVVDLPYGAFESG